MVVIGGVGESREGGSGVWLLECRCMVWREVRARAAVPAASAYPAGHAGLLGRGRMPLGDVQVTPFHTPTTHADGRLGSLVGHVCMAYDNLCIVHGGKLDGRLCGEWLWCLDLLTEVWTKMEIEGLTDEPGVKEGEKIMPSSRWKHCACTHTKVNATVKMERARRVPATSWDDVVAANAAPADALGEWGGADGGTGAGLYPLSGEEESQRRLKKIVHEERLRNEEHKRRDRDGLLMTTGSTPCVLRTTHCVLWGGGGQAKKTADLWELRLDDAITSIADARADGDAAHVGMSWQASIAAATGGRTTDDAAD